MENNILHLVVKKKWLDQINSGIKKEEFRVVKPYWMKRLTNIGTDHKIPLGQSLFKNFDVIKFRNGYSKKAPYIIAEFKGIEVKEIIHEEFGRDEVSVYVIKIGEILLSKKHNKPRRTESGSIKKQQL